MQCFQDKFIHPPKQIMVLYPPRRPLWTPKIFPCFEGNFLHLLGRSWLCAQPGGLLQNPAPPHCFRDNFVHPLGKFKIWAHTETLCGLPGARIFYAVSETAFSTHYAISGSAFASRVPLQNPASLCCFQITFCPLGNLGLSTHTLGHP